MGQTSLISTGQFIDNSTRDPTPKMLSVVSQTPALLMFNVRPASYLPRRFPCSSVYRNSRSMQKRARERRARFASFDLRLNMLFFLAACGALRIAPTHSTPQLRL